MSDVGSLHSPKMLLCDHKIKAHEDNKLVSVLMTNLIHVIYTMISLEFLQYHAHNRIDSSMVCKVNILNSPPFCKCTSYITASRKIRGSGADKQLYQTDLSWYGN